MKKQGLVIGRFQLVGNQHADLFEQIIEFHFKEQKLDQLYVVIGEANQVDERNPFPPEHCWEMIKPVAEKAAERMGGIPLHHQIIRDIGAPRDYAEHVSGILGFNPGENDLIYLFSRTEYTTQCFEGRKGYKVIHIQERIAQHSTKLRELYREGKEIGGQVPDHVLPLLEQYGAREKLNDVMGPLERVKREGNLSGSLASSTR